MTYVTQVPFQNQKVPVITDDQGNRHIPLRPITTLIGITWQSQVAKLRGKQYHLSTFTLKLPGEKRTRQHECLPLREFTAWLGNINTLKVSHQARGKLALAQAELPGCISQPSHPTMAAAPTALDTKEGPSQICVRALYRMIFWRLQSLPEAEQKSERRRIMACYEDEFGAPLDRTPASRFPAATKVLSRVLMSPLSAVSLRLAVSTMINETINSLVQGHNSELDEQLLQKTYKPLLDMVQLEELAARG